MRHAHFVAVLDAVDELQEQRARSQLRDAAVTGVVSAERHQSVFCCVIVSSCVLQLIKLHPCTYINDIHVHAYMYIMLCLGQTRTVNVRMHERVFDCNSM